MKSKNYIILITLIIFSLVSAVDYPKLNTHVNDYAHLLTPEEEESLSQIIIEIEKNTSVEIAIMTIKTTNGEDRVLYANHVGEKTGVGKKDTDNGVIILWSLENEEGGAIATGRGIESILNDAKVVRIGKAHRKEFDNKEYFKAFSSILMDIKSELKPEDEEIILKGKSVSEIPIYIIYLLIIVIFAFFILKILWRSKSSRKDYSSDSYDYSSNKRRRKDDDDYITARAGTIASSSSSSNEGGGFSFGGGSFGGGGGKF